MESPLQKHMSDGRVYQSFEEVENACYRYLESNLVQGQRWGLDYHFYKPSNTKYGDFQWLWDSAWHMITWSHRTPENGIKDLRTMLQFQQDDGFIPEMIYWGKWTLLDKLNARFFGYKHRKFTDITQMPILPYSVRALWEATHNDEILREFVPPLVKYYEWWENVRDPDNDGLVSIIHPWESGIDASPLYDPAHGVKNPSYKELYPKFLLLNRAYRKQADWDQQRILELELFNVEDVGVNAMYASGWRVLGELAENFDQELAQHCMTQNEYHENAILSKCWSEDEGHFVSFYHQDGEEKQTSIETIQSLFPLLLKRIPSALQTKVITRLTDPDLFQTPYPIPSTAKAEETFNPHQNRLLWRGPVWPCTVWLVLEGLLFHGHNELVKSHLEKWLNLYMKNGIFEYFNPLTGEGLGEEGLGMSSVLVDFYRRYHQIK